jgi:hypothetical protein
MKLTPEETEQVAEALTLGESKRSSGCASVNGSAAWTKTPPSTAGHYWVMFGKPKRVTVLEVEKWHGELQCFYFQEWRPMADRKYWKGVRWWTAMIEPPNADLRRSADNAASQPKETTDEK